MQARRTHIDGHCGRLTSALEALREEYEVPVGFPPEVLAEAEAATKSGPPAASLDLRETPFVTLDPAGSRDLDQAFHIERTETGYLLRYAIADVPGFVRAGGAIDTEARSRGQTLYLPDGRVPLHPPVLSEDRVSLLPGADRSSYVWTIPIDEHGAAAFEGASVPEARVERATIRSRAQLDYESEQHAIDAGAAAEHTVLLREFGELRIEQERRRGGASLNMPDEDIVHDEHGYRIVRSAPLPIEDWNAQLSLLAGMVAARMMLDGGVGILRTMPPPDEEGLAKFHAQVAALGLPWNAELPYGEYLRSVPRETAQGLAVLHAASSLFRGADYAVLAPGAPSPEQIEQAAIAAPYAHVTAPLRRLVDRWGLVVCESLSGGREVPAWALESLTEVPQLMRASSARAGQIGGAALDRVEAALLCDRIGEVFEATVLEASNSSARVQLEDPPVTARCTLHAAEPLLAGVTARVRVLRADVMSGEIELEAV